MSEYRGFKIGTTSYSMKEIKPLGKGSVPLELRGLYTREVEAKKDIYTFLRSKEIKNAKSKSTRRV